MDLDEWMFALIQIGLAPQAYLERSVTQSLRGEQEPSRVFSHDFCQRLTTSDLAKAIS